MRRILFSYEHPGYQYRLVSKALWMVKTHIPSEVRAEVDATRVRMGDVEADDLRNCCITYFKRGYATYKTDSDRKPSELRRRR